MVDMWDSEEGYICQGMQLGFVELGSAIVAGDILAWGTSAANKIIMTLYSGAGSGVAVALKGGVTGDKINALFYGVMKMVAHDTVTVGQQVINATTAGTAVTYGNVVPMASTNSIVAAGILNLACINCSGTIFKLGTALQTGTTPGDEILVLIGGLR